MQVEFLSKFNKDIDKVKAKSVRKSVLEIIHRVEKTSDLSEIPNLKNYPDLNQLTEFASVTIVSEFIQKAIWFSSRVSFTGKIL